MDGQLIALAALRWLHVTAAILWTGTAYFVNFVLAPAAASADAAASRKISAAAAFLL